MAGRIYDASRAFFDLPLEEKNAIGETGPVLGGIMHFGLAKEALAATLGGDPVPDLKEALDFGPGFHGDPWPVRPLDLEPAWRAYYDEMSALAAILRSIFAAALGLAPNFFEDEFRGHLSSLRVIDYPEQPTPPAPGQLRAGAHSDYGVLTILRTDDAPGGLQVRTRDGRWSGVPHIPRLVRHQHRRRDDALDQRSLDLDPAPRGEPAGEPRAADPPPVDRVLPQSRARHGGRVPAAVSRGRRVTKVPADQLR